MIKFDPSTHTYTTDEGKVLISVTQLLRKHSLAPSFDGVNKQLLEFKANRGTMIHKEIELFNKKRELGFTSEFEYYKDNIFDKFALILSEVMLFTALYAGTADIIAIDYDGCLWIIDIKTGQVHKEPTRWQLSLYLNALKEMTEKGLYINPCITKINKVKLAIFDAKEEGSKFYEVEPIAQENIQKLLKCEQEDTIYGTETALDATLYEKAITFEKVITELETQKKKLEEDYKAIKKQILEAMLKHGVKNYTTDRINITVKSAFTRTSVDSNVLKNKYPKIYDECSKTSKVAESLLVTLKEPANEV